MNVSTLREYLALEMSGTPFKDPLLEQSRQNYIASIVDLIIEANGDAPNLNTK